jgi:hypothetical protein
MQNVQEERRNMPRMWKAPQAQGRLGYQKGVLQPLDPPELGFLKKPEEKYKNVLGYVAIYTLNPSSIY